MSLPEPSSLPQQPASVSRARRRRARRLLIPANVEGRAALLASLAHRAYPSYELFVFAVLCGAVIGLGYILDSQILLIFGILLAPLMTPWIGVLLAIITGSPRFFFETFTALLVSAVLVFLSGLLAGFAVRLFLPRTLNEAFVHSRLWWPDLIILSLGAVILTISFIRSEEKPYLPSVMLAYGFFLPLNAAGFGLGSGVGDIWPHGVLVFLVHLAWATLFGLITLAALRFLPTSPGGIILSLGAASVLILTLVLLMDGGSWTRGPLPESPASSSLPAATLSPPPALSAIASSFRTASPQPSSTPLIATATPGTPSPVLLTLEVTLPPTETPTITLTIEPTPIYAKINAEEGGGAFLRKAPNGKFLTTLENGAIVEALPDIQEVNGVAWAHVIAVKNGIRMEGWVIQSVLVTATPVPNWQPSATPTNTPT